MIEESKAQREEIMKSEKAEDIYEMELLDTLGSVTAKNMDEGEEDPSQMKQV